MILPTWLRPRPWVQARTAGWESTPCLAFRACEFTSAEFEDMCPVSWGKDGFVQHQCIHRDRDRHYVNGHKCACGSRFGKGIRR